MKQVSVRLGQNKVKEKLSNPKCHHDRSLPSISVYVTKNHNKLNQEKLECAVERQQPEISDVKWRSLEPNKKMLDDILYQKSFNVYF